jgi:aminopeptidase N
MLRLHAQSPTEGVSRELAQSRASRISDVALNLSATAAPVVLDFRDGTGSSLTVNGTPAAAQPTNGHLVIPGQYFVKGRNRIALDFTFGIATSGPAITRLLDGDDGAQYIYSLFVPMEASQAFSCFDQPDLKACFDLDVTAPDAWSVVSNTRVESEAPAKSGFRRTDFAETQPLPYHLFAFAAGPTMRWFDDLWLKEGFAQYMAYQTLTTSYSPTEIWKRFYQCFKQSAYAIDGTLCTTPIHQFIFNLKDTKSAYGAIVYSKPPRHSAAALPRHRRDHLPGRCTPVFARACLRQRGMERPDPRL